MAAKAEVRAMVEQQDTPARVEKLAQWPEARGTAERAEPAAAEPQETGALAVCPAQRGVVGLGARENDIRP